MEQPEFTILQAGGPPERRAALGQALLQEGFRVAEVPFDLGSLPDLILLHAAPADADGVRLRNQMLSAYPDVPVLFVPPDSPPGGFLGMAQALSLARRYHDQLRLSDARCQPVLDSRPARIALVDKDGVITAVNKPWTDFVAAGDGNQAGLGEGADYLAACRKGAESGAEGTREFLDGFVAVLNGDLDHFSSVYPCDGPDGPAWFLARVTGLDGDDGRGAIVAHENITDLKRTQAELLKTGERLVTILDTLGEGFFVLDAQWRMTYVNKTAERLLRQPRDRLLGRVYWEAVPRSRESAGGEAFPRAVATQSPTTYLEHSGRLWLEVHATPSPEGLLVLIRDVTEQRQRAERDAANHIERLGAPVAAEVTASLFGSGSIREMTPRAFEELATTYEEVLDLALEQRGYKVSHNLSERLGDLAERLGFLRAGPRDLVALHSHVVKRKTRSAPGPKVQAVIEESRLLLLELMGDLVSHYRLQSLGARSG